MFTGEGPQKGRRISRQSDPACDCDCDWNRPQNRLDDSLRKEERAVPQTTRVCIACLRYAPLIAPAPRTRQLSSIQQTDRGWHRGPRLLNVPSCFPLPFSTLSLFFCDGWWGVGTSLWPHLAMPKTGLYKLMCLPSTHPWSRHCAIFFPPCLGRPHAWAWQLHFGLALHHRKGFVSRGGGGGGGGYPLWICRLHPWIARWVRAFVVSSAQYCFVVDFLFF